MATMKSRAPAKRERGRPPVQQPRPSVTLRLDPAQLERLDALATDKGTTRTALIQIAIARILKEGLR